MNFKKRLIFFIFFLCFSIINVDAYNKSVIDITKMDITELNKALNSEIITSEELINLYLDRINEYDKKYKAIITINENAIKEAKRLDQERKEGNVKSLLHGIPIIIKDNINVQGLPTTAGAKALKDNYPNDNSFAIQKLIDAGAIILAKANMSEFAFSAKNSNSSYGGVRNAYNLDYSPYGSSGGSAVSVAASFASAALGTDTNSSIRLPASASNLIGLRPSIGLISRSGVLPYDPERDTIGTLTKTVSDTIILMNILNGYDKNDEKSIKQEQKIYKKNKSDLKGIIIGIPTDFLYGSNDNKLVENQETYSEIKLLMEKAIENLKLKKANIIFLDNYYNFSTNNWSSNTLSGAMFCNAFNKYIKNTTGNIRDFQTLAVSNGITTNLEGQVSDCDKNIDMSNKNILKKDYENYINNIMEENNVDIIAYPASKNKLSKFNDIESLINLSSHASSTINFPTITLPLGFDKEGLPYGIEFMVPYKEEELLLNVVSLYEKDYLNVQTPKIAPSLYEIPKEVEKLVTYYRKIVQKNNKYFFEKEWLDEVKIYFREYSSSDKIDQEAKTLNIKYLTNESYAIILTGLLYLLKLILIIIPFIIAKNIYKIKKSRSKKH
ncbi:MAG: amidase [Bacilli bacterium]|nr:amidase [Bacilli bacterium]